MKCDLCGGNHTTLECWERNNLVGRCEAGLGDCRRRYTEGAAAWMRALGEVDDAKETERVARREMKRAWRRYEAAKSLATASATLGERIHSAREGLGLASDPARIAAKKAKLAKMNAYSKRQEEPR